MTLRSFVDETIDGPAGRAMRLRFEPIEATDYAASVAQWFIYAPGQSPAWARYGLGCVHLRDMPWQTKPATKKYPTMTHELLLLAYDPKADPQPTDPDSWRILSPINFVEQVELPNDEAAVQLTALCAKAIVNGILWAEPPLSGQKEPWLSALLQTSAHLRGEEHGR